MISFKVEKLKVSSRITLLSQNYPYLASQALYTSSLFILIPEIKKNLKKNNSIFEGNLFQRIDAKAKVSSGVASVDVGAIGVPYGLAVELGLPPGRHEKLTKLQRYARIKLGVSRKRSVYVGMALYKSILLKGTKGKPYLEPAFRDTKDALVKDFSTRLSESVKKALL